MLTNSKSALFAWLSRGLLVVSLLGFVVAVSGCNTWNGAGKDVERAGEKIQGK